MNTTHDPGAGNLAARALRTSLWTWPLLTAMLAAGAGAAAAWSFFVGGGLSVGSLASLLITLPRLLTPGRRIRSRLFCGLFYCAKLPLYLLALFAANRIRELQPMGLCLGVVLVPVVITLKVIGGSLAATEYGHSGA